MMKAGNNTTKYKPILEMIAEWEKGCGNATRGKPEKCHECTVALIKAIKEKEERQQKILKLLTEDEK